MQTTLHQGEQEGRQRESSCIASCMDAVVDVTACVWVVDDERPSVAALYDAHCVCLNKK